MDGNLTAMSKKDREPRPENKTNFYVPIKGKEVYLGPDNCTLYLHEYEPHFDHIFLEAEQDENGNRSGFFLWRLKQGNFDKMVEALQGLGTLQAPNAGWASEQDKNTFKAQGLTVPEFKEPELETLTPRQVNLVNFMSYILLHEQLNADEFRGDGDLYL